MVPDGRTRTVRTANKRAPFAGARGVEGRKAGQSALLGGGALSSTASRRLCVRISTRVRRRGGGHPLGAIRLGRLDHVAEGLHEEGAMVGWCWW
jgi:hypothetical protein